MSINQVGILLFVAAVVSMLCRRFKVPYTVGLTLAGFGIGFLPRAPEIPLTKDLIFSALLPPLIFEAAFQIPWNELKADLAVIGSLATVGVLIAVAVVTAGLSFGLGWPVLTALVLAVLLSATDPVSVIATFKYARVPERLKLLVEAESLFNDGTAAVLFSVVLAILSGHGVTLVSITSEFVLTVVGGVLIGSVIAGLALFLTGHAKDHLAEITFSTLAAYASFLIAEHLHFSGVLATLTAGLVLGNARAFAPAPDHGRDALESFWEYIAFVANSLIFLLIGLRIADRPMVSVWIPCCAVIVLTLVGRSAGVYGICLLFSKSRNKVSLENQHMLVWGGLRGALALALALGLPKGMARKEEILDITFGVVAFSVIVQGLTISPMLKRLGLVSESS